MMHRLSVVRWLRDAATMEKEQRMPYVTSWERLAEQRGLRKGIAALLKIRFGAEGLQLMPQIELIYYTDQLESILIALETASSLDEVQPLCAIRPPKEGDGWH